MSITAEALFTHRDACAPWYLISIVIAGPISLRYHPSWMAGIFDSRDAKRGHGRVTWTPTFAGITLRCIAGIGYS